MKRSFRLKCKILTGMLILVSVLGMTACSSKESGENTTYVSLAKDGKVRSDIAESFEQSYYDKDELQQTILAEAASYNRSVGNGNITVEKVEVKNGVAVVQMIYADAKDYAAFNKTDFFVGTAKEAQEAGYDLNVVLSGVKDSGQTVGQADILAMKDVRLLITDISDAVMLNGKALYISENVTASENAKVVQRAVDSEKKAYIIFK